MSIAVPFASDAKSLTLLQFNERNSKAVAGHPGCVSMVSKSGGEHHVWRTCNLQRYRCRVANFIIEITKMHTYDFGPKAMHSNAGL